MNSIINDLLGKITSEDTKIRDNAIIDISVIIEMHTWGLCPEKRRIRFGSLVSQKILDIDINENEETQIINFLANAIANGHIISSSLLAVMGFANAKVALLPLTEVIEKYFDKFDKDEVHQCLVALDRLLFWNESISFAEKYHILQSKNTVKIIAHKIILLQPISHLALKDISLLLLARLILLENEYSTP